MRSGLFAITLLLLSTMNIVAQTSTPLPAPSPTPGIDLTAEVTPEPNMTEVIDDPLLDLSIEPPLDIDLPQDWLFGYDTLVFREFDGTLTTVPIAIYRGPVTGGTGEIVLLWNFDSIVDPFSGAGQLWLDGVRLMRQLIFEAECNIGRFPPDEYSLGGDPVVGVRFAAVDCPVGADTRGWFVVKNDLGINFAFYVYAEPITVMDGTAAAELQAILDSIVLRVEDITIDAEALAGTQQALEGTVEALLTQNALETPEATEAP